MFVMVVGDCVHVDYVGLRFHERNEPNAAASVDPRRVIILNSNRGCSGPPDGQGSKQFQSKYFICKMEQTRVRAVSSCSSLTRLTTLYALKAVPGPTARSAAKALGPE